LTVEKYSFDPTGSGLIVGAFGVQFAGQTAHIANNTQHVLHNMYFMAAQQHNKLKKCHFSVTA